MKNLFHVLPPLASDYSGVCSVLYDLDVATVICDAGCCTDHYVHYEESRWPSRQKNVYSVMLRNLDMVLGNEALLVDRVVATVEKLRPRPWAVAVVGTPVPAITGMDLQGIACEVGARLDLPAFGFNTTGFKQYAFGVAAALGDLVDALAVDARTRSKRRVAYLLGVSPFELGTNDDARLVAEHLGAKGWSEVRALPWGANVDSLRQLGASGLNVALSSPGVTVARKLERRFSTPYRVGYPVLGDAAGPTAHAVLNVVCNRRTDASNAPVLVIHDQVVGMSLRAMLRAHGCTAPVVVGGFTAWHDDLAEPCDFCAHDEGDLTERIRALQPQCVVGDPLLERLLRRALCVGGSQGPDRCPLVPLTYAALSGKLGWERPGRLYGSKGV